MLFPAIRVTWVALLENEFLELERRESHGGSKEEDRSYAPFNLAVIKIQINVRYEELSKFTYFPAPIH